MDVNKRTRIVIESWAQPFSYVGVVQIMHADWFRRISHCTDSRRRQETMEGTGTSLRLLLFTGYYTAVVAVEYS